VAARSHQALALVRDFEMLNQGDKYLSLSPSAYVVNEGGKGSSLVSVIGKRPVSIQQEANMLQMSSPDGCDLQDVIGGK